MNKESYLQSEERQKLIEKEKISFMEGRTVDGNVVSDVIIRSWTRSRAYQVDPYKTERPKVSEAQLSRLMRANADLLSCSRTILDQMFSSMQEAVSALTLASAEGVTLYISNRVAHERFYPDAKVGSINTEEARGTNGIGTCIAERTPVEIIGAEHYRLKSGCWSCSSAPIFSSEGQLLGVLNVTQDRTAYHAHTLGMVKAAAFAIMEQLRLRRLLQQREIIMDQLGDGIMVITASGTIDMMNNKAANMLGLRGEHANIPLASVIRNGNVFQCLTTGEERIDRQELVIPLLHGSLTCLVSLFPLSGGSRVVTLRGIKRERQVAVQMAGVKAAYTFDRILGNSAPLLQIMDLARMVASNNTTVLLLGESGTGKELFAQAIHNASPRSSQPFVAVNCGAIPHDLVESELFGYEGGAFTGANRSGKPGKFELADGGTIFLDEIGDLPLDAQGALLRLLQNGEVSRVGGKRSHLVSVRVIAATNKNLVDAVKERSFREDLYYRLNVFPLNLPPLRNRIGDVSLLAHHFLHHFARSLNKDVKGFSPEALELLVQYDWPGNIRELENIMERMVNIVRDGEYIDCDILPSNILSTVRQQHTKKKGMLFSSEADSILNALKHCGGNMKQAAELLGISRGGLYIKVKRFGIDINEIRK